MVALITGHVWRPVHDTHSIESRDAIARHLCGYMSCRQPIGVHERAVNKRPARTAAGAR